MSEQVKPRVRVPKTAKAGEVIEIKTLISHVMETGLRKDKDGNPIPRKIIHTFACTYNGKQVFEAKLEPAIAANPYIAFFVRATESGSFDFAWTEDDGTVHTAREEISVT